MHLICKDNFGKALVDVYVEIGKGCIDGEPEDFDEIYVHDFSTHELKWLDEREYMDTNYMDLYDYAREYLQEENLIVEEA